MASQSNCPNLSDWREGFKVKDNYLQSVWRTEWRLEECPNEYLPIWNLLLWPVWTKITVVSAVLTEFLCLTRMRSGAQVVNYECSPTLRQFPFVSQQCRLSSHAMAQGYQLSYLQLLGEWHSEELPDLFSCSDLFQLVSWHTILFLHTVAYLHTHKPTLAGAKVTTTRQYWIGEVVTL